jgi:hypothetical protein
MIQYLDLPALEIKDIRSSLIATDLSYSSVLPGYLAYDINPESENYKKIKDMFPEDIFKEIYKVTLQVIEPSWNGYIHKDPRDYAINYLLDTGESDVTTSLYDDDKNLISCSCIPLYKWHLLHTHIYHAVDNIKIKRAGISLSIKNPTARLMDWINSIDISNTLTR